MPASLPNAKQAKLVRVHKSVAGESFFSWPSGALDWVRKSGRNYSITEAIQLSKAFIESSGMLQVEYLDIADESNLLTLQSWDQQLKARAFTAVRVGDVRLIDNMPL